MTAKKILDTILKGTLSGVGSTVGSNIANDLYKEIKTFLINRSDSEKKLLITPTSFKKPPTFVEIELNRISNEARAYLLSRPVSERRKLIEHARQRTTGDNEQMLFNLIRLIVQNK